MLTAPPRERVWLSWFFAGLWAVAIYLTVPFARPVARFVRENLGGEFFLIVVYAALALTAIWLTVFLRRYPYSGIASYIWLGAVAAAFGWLTWGLNASPEEALHFVQYGVLGVFLYRALSHHLRDVSIYFVAGFCGAFLGALDEAIRWLTPARVWDLRDIGINFSAVALVQLAIAMGLRPPLIERRFRLASLPALCGSAFVFTAFLGACLLNTPSVIRSYVDYLPGWLSHLESKTSQMAEYGYLYRDTEIGIFRSRLSPENLRATDRRRAAGAAPLLRAARGKEKFVEFIRAYTPLNDPFLHEVRLHLRSRDANIQYAEEIRESRPNEYRLRRRAAFRENRILEKYFPETLRASGLVLTPEMRRTLEKETPGSFEYESQVSVALISGTTPREAAVIIIFLLATLFAVMQISRRHARRNGR